VWEIYVKRISDKLLLKQGICNNNYYRIKINLLFKIYLINM